MPHLHHGASPLPVAPALAVLLVAFVYLRGWVVQRSSGSNAIRWRHAVSFFVGLFLIWIAVGSPLAVLDHEWLTAHMVQHLLLMTLGPPFVWLGAPAAVRRWRSFSQPTVGWLIATGVLVGWHVPVVFTLGMQSPAWHAVERASFLIAGLLFWLPVIGAWSTPPGEARWGIVVYLFLATLPCDILSGFLVFSERVAYPIYFSTARHPGMSVLADQECAGAVMWTAVTIVFLCVGTILTARWLTAPCGGAGALRRQPRVMEAA